MSEGVWVHTAIAQSKVASAKAHLVRDGDVGGWKTFTSVYHDTLGVDVVCVVPRLTSMFDCWYQRPREGRGVEEGSETKRESRTDIS